MPALGKPRATTTVLTDTVRGLATMNFPKMSIASPIHATCVPGTPGIETLASARARPPAPGPMYEGGNGDLVLVAAFASC